MSWRREWQPTSVFLPGESHGQKSLEGYCPWDHKELDMIEQITVSLSQVLTSLLGWGLRICIPKEASELMLPAWGNLQ